MCYAADRAGHRHGRRRRGGRGRRPGRGLRDVRSATSSGSRGCCSASSATCPTRRLRLLDVGRRPRADLRAPVRVLLTGAAGFIGVRDRRASWPRPATRSSPSTCCCRRRTASTPPSPTACTGSTSATPPTGPTCSTASTWSATRPRWSARASRVGRPAGVRRPQRPRHRRAAGRDARRAASTGWCSPPRWWSTARGATPAPSTATGQPAPRAVDALDAGDFDNHCPDCGRPLGWELVDEDARLDPRSSYAASKVAQEHYTSAWARQARRRRDRAEVPQRLRARHAPGHAVLRRRRDLPLLARARRGAAGLRGRRPDARLRARRRRRPRQRAGAPRGRRAAGRRVRGLQRLLGQPGLDPRGGRPGRPRPRRRRGAAGHRGVPLRRRPPRRRLPGAGPRELGFTAAITPEQGLAEFATAPLRG